jgi:hypothetical protein
MSSEIEVHATLLFLEESAAQISSLCVADLDEIALIVPARGCGVILIFIACL